MKPLIYVAGPYTHPDPVLNVREACLVGDQITAMGAAAVVPHLSMLWHTISPRPIDVWYARDLDLLDHCHAVALLPGESKGAEAEVCYARDRGIPVWSTDHPAAMRHLHAWIRDWRP
jgi:hypothetical protein